MTRPRLLDLFCCQGGAAMGYHRAGFDVLGVDIAPQPRYPFEFVQTDALSYPLDGFDVIHASPPCQSYSRMSACRPGLAATYPDLIDPVRQRLLAHGAPFVIENVPGSPLRRDADLCGCMFGLRSPRGLGVRRPRWFEIEPQIFILTPAHDHSEPALPVTGHSPGKEWREAYLPMLRRRAMATPYYARPRHVNAATRTGAETSRSHPTRSLVAAPLRHAQPATRHQAPAPTAAAYASASLLTFLGTVETQPLETLTIERQDSGAVRNPTVRAPLGVGPRERRFGDRVQPDALLNELAQARAAGGHVLDQDLGLGHGFDPSTCQYRCQYTASCGARR